MAVCCGPPLKYQLVFGVAYILGSRYLWSTVSLDGLSLEGLSPLASAALLGYDT